MKQIDFNKLLAGSFAGSPPARAFALSPTAKKLTAGVPLNGTSSWEMETIIEGGIYGRNGIELSLMDVVHKQAGHVAFLSGAAIFRTTSGMPRCAHVVRS
ncbi:hypothetical protein JQU17_12000 [Ponticoccus sp. SC2-23]|uniref:hypothetical protein n=1 Tax=Alexandriicola marinus TaxID=2081710 RepID=UPI000FD6F588|nr:hypothetical protein [Alexandriicola marinus]MBM1221619.1 hypothetical protein [Ponticoccus sp. SC6-9]MBM1226660.1 hypothetical protein [Ponticoccus sp. SC6-15]MBM1230611.1 hypothetical protein [Ponticoccus sp. SC6-38]MBM1235134.1 hypothetical protein [Ponticoccus sp. SC6-45]MBM1239632.1 hypothetical protein [Ponticoccus sp. SC6-49]MBM1243414.1 hypothetical protein [Ponticoccus sp. SC2-64]MBM1248658.1 hypothetical protein [Ponticoccus sp. SC6-42]MBM1253243.1 hypothetical protein [Pontico